MSGRRLAAALLFFGLGTVCLAAVAPLARYATRQFAEGEPFFSSPLRPSNGLLKIRSDINGKGHFGASRNGGRTHQGVDLLAALEDPVFAAKSGRIVQAGWQKGYGEVVKISHPDGSLTVYAHLSRVLVHDGDWVAALSTVGRVGKSGNASERRTLPHLHFEVRYREKPVNPLQSTFDPRVKIL